MGNRGQGNRRFRIEERIARIRVVDAGTDDINASASVDFLTSALPHSTHPRFISRINDVGGNGLTSLGKPLHDGDIEIAENRHGDASWDWRCSHDQLVDQEPIISAISKCIALLDTKTMLLVDHGQSQVGEEITSKKQGVGANDNERRPRGKQAFNFAPSWSRCRGREKAQIDWKTGLFKRGKQSAN